ncbi:MAG TPA: sulfite exporter TauE/SafE family protein [Vicinamibacterales bacterium]|nr:sulfite exporter TauE/SafE family protein [Vicinamibacterales bacterium]
MGFTTLVAVASVIAGAIASVAGFAIGSILTPVFNTRVDMRLAVAAVSIPHFVATAVRFWRMRRDTNRRVLKTFGVMSAAGGLTGAVLQQYASSPILIVVFAALLVFVGIADLTGLSERMRFGRTAGWIAGTISGLLGGLVGNQGGIRSAALLGYDLSPAQFVATATAIGLIVDAARMPVYVATDARGLVLLGPTIIIATAGTVAGTFAGERILERIPPRLFRKLVAMLVLALGLYMFSRAVIL